MLITSESTAYILYGPVQLDDLSEINTQAQIVTNLGKAAFGHGNVFGSDADDLVFLDDASMVHVVEGGTEFSRDLNVRSEITFAFPTPGASSEVHVLNWNGDASADILLARNTLSGFNLGEIRSGSDLTGSPLVTRFALSPGLLLATLQKPLGGIVSPAASFSTTNVGDVNGDGLDDLLFASPDLVTFGDGVSLPLGVSFLVMGGTAGTGGIIDLVLDSEAIFTGTTLGDVVSALGDINNDGYDDFAVSRAREGTGGLSGGLFVYLGQPEFRSNPSLLERLTTSDASIVIRRDQAGACCQVGPFAVLCKQPPATSTATGPPTWSWEERARRLSSAPAAKDLNATPTANCGSSSTCCPRAPMSHFRRPIA